MNAQDVLRDVHDPSQHALKTTASLSASTVYVGTPTLFAVVKQILNKRENTAQFVNRLMEEI